MYHHVSHISLLEYPMGSGKFHKKKLGKYGKIHPKKTIEFIPSLRQAACLIPGHQACASEASRHFWKNLHSLIEKMILIHTQTIGKP